MARTGSEAKDTNHFRTPDIKEACGTTKKWRKGMHAKFTKIENNAAKDQFLFCPLNAACSSFAYPQSR